MRVRQAHRVGLAVAGELRDAAPGALSDFASLGSQGKHPASIERDLQRWLAGAFGLGLKISYIKLEVSNPDGSGTLTVDHPVLSPRDLVHELWLGGSQLFHASMVGHRGGPAINEFWQKLRHERWVSTHPWLKPPVDRGYCIPLWVHGDGARAFKCQKLLIISYMSALVSGCSWSSRFIYTVIPCDRLHGNTTLQHLLQAFASDLNLLQAGCMADGSPICGPYRCVYAGSKGDLEWHWQAYQLPRYYRCNLLCQRCYASKRHDGLLWTDFRDTAGWRLTTVATHDFLSSLNHRGLQPALCNIDGWAAETMHWDFMHNVFLGIGKDVCGSTIALLVRNRYFAYSNDSDIQLKVCSKACKSWCSKHKLTSAPHKLDHRIVGIPALARDIENQQSFAEVDLKAAHIKTLILYLAFECFFFICVG